MTANLIGTSFPTDSFAFLSGEAKSWAILVTLLLFDQKHINSSQSGFCEIQQVATSSSEFAFVNSTTQYIVYCLKPP